MKEKTPHILSAASNLLGFCFFVLVTIKTAGDHQKTFSDEFVAISILLLAVSIFLSFLSIRSVDEKAEIYERWADYTFLAGIISIIFIALLLLVAFV